MSLLSLVVIGAASTTVASAGVAVAPPVGGPTAVAPAARPGDLTLAGSALRTGRSAVVAIDLDRRSVVVAGAGQRMRTVASGFADPVALVADGRTTAFVLDAGSHQLLRVGIATGRKTVLRSAVTAGATMALDDAGNLYVLDGITVLKFAAGTGAPKVLGPTTPGGRLTVDGRGDVSISSPQLTLPTGVRIKTFPASGAAPRYRNIGVLGETDDGGTGPVESLGYLSNAVESRDGSIVLELLAVGASGAHLLVRVPASSAVGTKVDVPDAEYAYAFDRANSFYLAANRLWCNAPARRSGCVDDYRVAVIDAFRAGATTPAARPVTGLSLPVGGLAADDSGRLYGAVVASKFAAAANAPRPALVTIDRTGRSAVLASGHFASPAVLELGCRTAA